MKSLRFATTIHAPRKAVWDAMLAPDTYRIWTAPFMEGSYYEGSWVKGARIRFLAPDGSGARYPNLSLFVPADRVPADRQAPSPVLV